MTYKACRCGALIQSNDTEHQCKYSKPWKTTTKSAHQRGYGRQHRLIRAQVLAANPICQRCGQRPSTEADHIVNLQAGGAPHPANYQALCDHCHKQKTQRESHR